MYLKHGHAKNGKKSQEWNAWANARARCHNPNNPMFYMYGGRGIQMCEEWRKSFPKFIEHIGPKPNPSLTLDRIDNNRGYEPGNVRWVSLYVQCQNKRTTKFGLADYEAFRMMRAMGMTFKKIAELAGTSDAVVLMGIRSLRKQLPLIDHYFPLDDLK